ncbi:TadG family pilus assembly protein [Sphingomonas naphthae]|uniref:TadG family pilus assembly protein n=1 Tax=Sphingomonas naphthae TaxID=1813468 RepID=A0ABY7TQ77_9SPHN|nr:TadG family pilus assembly protein [Sphingomonas naphthae]WCT75105.1 TadG family pilus assembly protein [Sphingomonas naphthae]
MRSLWRDRRGAVTILVAVMLVASMASLAFAVDAATVFADGRRLQGIADASALSAAANISAPTSAVTSTISDNGWASRATASEVTTGSYDVSAAMASRFTAGGSTPNAVRVTLQSDSPLFFGKIFGRNSFRVSRTATATKVDLASFSLGSRLASLDGGIANALLSGLTGTTVNLTLMDYQALVDADIDLLAFSKILQTQLSAQAMTFEQTLAISNSVGNTLGAIASTLDAQGSTTAAAAVRKIVPSTIGMSATSLSALISLGPIGKQDHAAPGAPINANSWDLIQALLQTSGGPRQITANLGTGIPGLANVKLYIAIGDRMVNSPWLTVTNSGTTVIRTSQTRIYLDTNVLSVGLLSSLYNVASIRLPLYVELAEAQAKLSTLSCVSGSKTAALLVKPGIGHASIAEVPTTPASTFTNQTVALPETPAAAINLLLLTVTINARTDLSSQNWQTVPFTNAEISAQTVKTVTATGAITALATSLTKSLSIGVQLGALKLPSLTVGALVGDLLEAAGPPLDAVLGSVTNLLGIRLGQADVRINGVRCGVPSLVA